MRLRGPIVVILISALQMPPAGVSPALAQKADAERPEWAGPACDQAWDYQGELPLRSVPIEAWEQLSTDSLDGDLNRNLVQALEGALDSLLVLTGAPAIGVAVGIPGQGIWRGTVGLARTKPEEPVTEDAMFHAASIGKAFTAALMVRAVEQRLVDLHTTVISWFSEYPNARYITVDHLLTHSAGVYNFSDHKRFQKTRGFEAPEKLIEFAAKQEPRFCPGAQWNYSNTGYVMLGRVLERLRGRSLQELIELDIVERLGLENTVPRYDRDVIENHVTGHENGKPLKKVSYALPHGAGVVSSTPDDLVRFWHALLTGQIVSRGNVELMCSDMFPMFGNEESFYGRGIMTYDVPGPGLIIGHGGGIRGFRSVVGYVVDDRVYVAVMANSDAPVEAALWKMVRTVRAFRAGAE